MDTEDQLISRRLSISALIQMEYVYEDNSPILLLIECMYLPKQNDPTLIKTIFSMRHNVYMEGIENEIKDFYQYNLFDKNDVNHVNNRNIQDEFKNYYNTTYPTSPDIKLKSNETYSLQFAIFNTFNEWLNERFTLENFG
ncbi:unnamed protein product [Adineta steineri]|uniref:Uncharacterized protein n=1 Tax=Adineta steineri TaxID=433720 RepID=A0A814RT09_9BILA|nr:unnamed protein product [Adineta steineri]CAF1405133.1 unnamed protein product [Adineta steineri]